MRARPALLLAGCVVAIASPGAARGQSGRAYATIVGTIFDSLRTVAPLKHATVVIPELSRYVTADDQGRFQIDSVPAGRYSITFLHPVLDSLDVSAEILPITVPDKGVVTARLATPSPAALVWLICRATSDTFPAMMLGHVRDVDDSAGVAGATVTVAWSELVMGGLSLEQRTTRTVALTRANGGYLLCGVPPNTRLEVTVAIDDRSTGPLVLPPDGDLLIRRDFRIGRQTASATVSGTVHDALGNPAGNASVTVLGPQLRAVTDEEGRFTLRAVPSGTQVFETSQIGSWPRSELVDVPAVGRQEIRLALGRRAPGLPRVQTAGTKPDDPTGFDERRWAGIGQFVVPEDIEKRPPRDLVDLLLRAPMLFMGGGRLKLIKMHGAERRECVPIYFINGYPWHPGIPPLALSELQSVIELPNVKGVEVYAPAAVPPRFDRKNGCGSVVLWTKR